MQKIPLSLVVITFNEELNIARCLKSVPFASDVVVVDSLSQDRTCEIAESLGARVYREPWRGFGKQKAYAVSLAKEKWILSLDADEALSPELAQEIISRFVRLQDDTGYKLPRVSYHLGRWLHNGGWYPDFQLRLFNKTKSNFDESEVHEKVIVDKIEKFKNPIKHWVFKSLSHQVLTNDKYSTLGAQEAIKKGQKFALSKLLFKPVGKFIECYIVKKGFLDGMAGFIIAIGAAYSMFLKFAKVWEAQNRQEAGDS